MHREEVFGLNRRLPANYVFREAVDGEFLKSLKRKTIVVIHGSSKQGKTSLRRKHLKDAEYVPVACLSRWTLEELQGSILKAAGFRIEQSETKTLGNRHKFIAETGVKVGIAAVAEASTKASGESEKNDQRQIVSKRLELDLGDPNDIIFSLREIGFDRYILLEDFHYLPLETQQEFASVLKAFYDNSDLTFIIVGVWKEKDRLAQINGDLSGRIIPIDADKWSASELESVVGEGEKLLNVRFPPFFRRELVQASFGNVYLVQEACNEVCIENQVEQTVTSELQLTTKRPAAELVSEIVQRGEARFSALINRFPDGYEESDYQMYKWVLWCVLRASQKSLTHGIHISEMFGKIREYHPQGNGLRRNNLYQALIRTPTLQLRKGISPIILDYNTSEDRLNIVDQSFLIWMRFQDKSALLSEYDVPIAAKKDLESD